MLIPDRQTRDRVIELRRQQGLPLQFRLMDKNNPIPITPKNYELDQIGSLQQSDVMMRGNEFPKIESKREDAVFNYDKLKHIVHTVGTADPIEQLDNKFEKRLISDLILFHEKYPQYKSIGLSSTYRSVEKQSNILVEKLFTYNSKKQKTELQALYGHGTRKELFDYLGALAMWKKYQGISWHTDNPIGGNTGKSRK